MRSTRKQNKKIEEKNVKTKRFFILFFLYNQKKKNKKRHSTTEREKKSKEKKKCHTDNTSDKPMCTCTWVFWSSSNTLSFPLSFLPILGRNLGTTTLFFSFSFFIILPTKHPLKILSSQSKN